eukprot:1244560-Pleurochrysis_carterae.AAC.1
MGSDAGGELARLRGGLNAGAQRGEVGHARTEQRNPERSASAPQVHKPCECRNGKLCMRVTKVKSAAAIAGI